MSIEPVNIVNRRQRAPEEADVESLKPAYLSNVSVKLLKSYYEEYRSEAQKWGFRSSSFSSWVADMAVEGYLSNRQRRQDMLRREKQK